MKLLDDWAMRYCIIVLLMNGVVLYVYHYHCNPNNDIERYYLKNSKCQFYVLKFVYLVIVISAIVSARYLLVQVPKHLTKTS
jgi:hypothetical protein